MKEQRIVEFDVTEKVVNRLVDWGKIIAVIFAILAAAAGYLGLQTFFSLKSDITAMRDGAKKDLQTSVDDAKQQAAQLKKQVADSSADITGLQTESAKLKSTYAELDNAAQAMLDQKAKLDALAAQTQSQSQQLETLQTRVDQLNSFQPLPPATGPKPYHLQLSQIIGEAATEKIQNAGQLVFQVTGGTGGVKNPGPQASVASALVSQLNSADNLKPAFLYLLGNLTYYDGDANNYYDQFYHPYAQYDAPIFAIPGNHDGTPNRQPSLTAFMANFCSPSPTHTPEAGSAERKAMTQPNSYWTLETPYATIIGLYTNIVEGGAVNDEQKAWLVTELKTAPKDKALIVTLHHSPYAIFSMTAPRGQSPKGPMGKVLDDAIAASGRSPDIVLSAESHIYMRFTRKQPTHGIPYLVLGTGGYFNLFHYPNSAPRNVPAATQDREVTLERYDDTHHGFMKITVSKKELLGEYFTVAAGSGSEAGAPILADSFTLDLGTHQLTGSATTSSR
jgi:hypothetical protein